jgi:hypothetical protein
MGEIQAQLFTFTGKDNENPIIINGWAAACS